MKSYKSTTLEESFRPFFAKIHKKFNNNLTILKELWSSVPDWAKKAKPYIIKNNILYMKAEKKDSLLLQYKEQEIINIVNAILVKKIKQIKIIAL